MSSTNKGKSSRLKSTLLFPFTLLSRFWRWYLHLYKGTRWWVKMLAAASTFVFLVVFYVFAVVVNLFWLFGKSPSVSDIMHPKTPEASEILTQDGHLIGKFFDENRSSVPYDSINPMFFKVLVSTEDERFYDHCGIDFQGIASAAKDAAQGKARGASTITQQLVKNMFRIRTNYSTGLLGKVPGLGIFIKKSKEMIIAVQLEMLNDKEDILRMYANTVDFGSNAFGIKTAAKTYFDTTPSKLKVEEAAVLVGLLKATSTYNPRLNPKNSLSRRNVVLENLCSHHHITRQECDSLKRLPIKLKFNVENAYDGEALYFRVPLLEYFRANCPDLDPYSDGLKIYTTIDSRMQKYAEEAVLEQMAEVQKRFDDHWKWMGEPWRDANGRVIPNFIEKIARTTSAYKYWSKKFPNNPDTVAHFLNQPHLVKLFDYNGGHEEMMSTMDSIRYMVRFLHTGFMAVEPNNGYVKAYVGDVDFDTWKYDKVRAQRQPGSTFKLFVYAEAMEQGLTPRDTRKDGYIRMEVYDKKRDTTTIWQPHNANGVFTNAHLPLRSAFAASVNTIAVNLGQEVGIDSVVARAKVMGIKSPLEATPSLPLGSSDVNLFEMVNAYATVANGGTHVDPVLIDHIEDAEGNVVFKAPLRERQALKPVSAFYLQKMMEAGVTDGGGTSMVLANHKYMGPFRRKMDFGGKTGTSNNHSDAWFVGVTPHLVGGAWVGGEYRSIHFRTGKLGQGSRTALPIFGLFMRKVLNDPQLAPLYMVHYEPLEEKVDPSTYEYVYVPQDTLPDLVVDSLQVQDLHLGEGSEAQLEESLRTQEEETVVETPESGESEEWYDM